MQVAKIILAPILIAIVVVFASIGVLVAATAHSITNKSDIKLLLSSHVIYKQLSAVLTDGAADNLRTTSNSIGGQSKRIRALNQRTFKHIFEQYFTPDVYSHSVNTILDSTYDWLDGKTSHPTFSIAITDNKAQFHDFIVKNFVERFNALPTCQANFSPSADFNPLEANCKPAGYSSRTIKDFIETQVSQPEFNQLYSEAAINSGNLFGRVDPRLNEIKDSVWPWLKRFFWIWLSTLLGACGLLGIVLWNKSRSFKVVGLSLLIPATLTLLLSLAAFTFGNTFIDSNTTSAAGLNDNTNKLIAEFTRGLFHLINTQILIYSLGLVVFGLVLLILSRLLKDTSKFKSSY